MAVAGGIVQALWGAGMSATEILSDGRTVWVNGQDGCCLARFSYMGIDIHKDARGQMEEDKQCLDCKHGPTTLEDWECFKKALWQYYQVRVCDDHRPTFLGPRT